MMNIRNKESRIVSIVTLYNPKDEQIKNISNIEKQSDIVVVCDNSINSHHECFTKTDKCLYFHWGKNYGLSKAFNMVLKDEHLHWKNDDIIVFFDQDSILPDNHINKLFKDYKYLNDKGIKIGCIGPIYYDCSTGKEEVPRMYKKISESIFEVDSIVTTSMMCDYRTIREIGFWNEDIFLDMADWDICWRLIEHGYKVCLTSSSILHHRVGEGVKKLGPFRLRIGKPFREYYEIRDCMKLIFKDYVPIKYKIRFVAMLTVRPIIRIILLEYRRMRFMYYLKGLMDGFRNRTGGI